MVSNSNFRRRLIRTLTFLGGLYFFLQFVLPESALVALGVNAYHENISYGFIVIGSAAFGLGLINLFYIHGTKIAFRRPGWIHSAALLIGLMGMMYITAQDWLGELSVARETRELTMLSKFANQIKSDSEKQVTVGITPAARNALLRTHGLEAIKSAEARADAYGGTLSSASDVDAKLGAVLYREYKEKSLAAKSQLEAIDEATDVASVNPGVAITLQGLAAQYGKLSKLAYAQTIKKKLFDFLNFGFFVALGSAMFSLLGVYIAAAAYRAFRIRSFESSLMMIAAVIVMLGQIPFGIWLYSGLPSWRLWLLQIPNGAAFRAIKIGASIAGLVLAFRMWFSIESESFIDEERRG